jgi:hypothetical protein
MNPITDPHERIDVLERRLRLTQLILANVLALVGLVAAVGERVVEAYVNRGGS